MASLTARSRQPLPLLKAARLWRDDPDNDRNQRELCEAVDAIAPDSDLDTSAAMIAFLDASITLPGYKSLRLFAKDYEDGQAERVLRLWASARHLTLHDRTDAYDATEHDGAHTIRSLEARLGPGMGDGFVCLQWPSEPAVTAAAVADALRPWRPTDEPHWSDDKTTALDATTAGDRS